MSNIGTKFLSAGKLRKNCFTSLVKQSASFISATAQPTDTFLEKRLSAFSDNMRYTELYFQRNCNPPVAQSVHFSKGLCYRTTTTVGAHVNKTNNRSSKFIICPKPERANCCVLNLWHQERSHAHGVITGNSNFFHFSNSENKSQSTNVLVLCSANCYMQDESLIGSKWVKTRSLLHTPVNSVKQKLKTDYRNKMWTVTYLGHFNLQVRNQKIKPALASEWGEQRVALNSSGFGSMS